MNATFTTWPPLPAPTANDRLKARFTPWFWGSLGAAALIHFGVLAFWPPMRVADASFESREISVVQVVPEVTVPPPPERILRPAIPVLATDVTLSSDITLDPPDFNRVVSELPPPPVGQGADLSEEPILTPYEVKPELKNRAEFAKWLERRYPPVLREAGIGGTVVLWVFIDASGAVQNTRVTQSSGQAPLDAVAQEVMRQARFSPALNRDQRVPVWIQLPVTFQTR